MEWKRDGVGRKAIDRVGGRCKGGRGKGVRERREGVGRGREHEKRCAGGASRNPKRNDCLCPMNKEDS